MPDSKFKLPKGVTGLSKKTRPDSGSVARFKSGCYEAARRDMSRVSGFARAGITPNFHQATIKNERRDLIVVCHEAEKYIAFAKVSNDARLEFIDDPGLEKSFKLQGYTVLGAALLTEPLNQDNCSELDESEINEVKYWRCKTIGEVIFNWFD